MPSITTTTQTTSTIKIFYNIKMLCNIVIISTIASSFVLSVDAIKCHQCNSHLDEDCIKLRLSTPGAVVDPEYLRECHEKPGKDAYCRKTTLNIEATGEHRIVRGCGWTEPEKLSDQCFSADNEGYVHTICSCVDDGCNAAPSLPSNANLYLILSLFGVLFLFSRPSRISF